MSFSSPDNVFNLVNPNPPKIIRETFGIMDGSTGRLYPDIIDYHIEVLNFYNEYLFQKTILAIKTTIAEKDREYTLHMDSKLKRKLKSLAPYSKVTVIVSFQERTSGNIALARIYGNKEVSLVE